MSQTLPNITLDKFIKNMGNYRFWDEDMIQAYIAPEDQMALRGIHLPITVAPDRLLWNYNTIGDYTVRSGYWLYTHDPSYTGPLLPAPHGSLDLKKQIWKLSIQPKIKHFLWRVLSKALATSTRLISRGMAIDPICPHCRNSDETINHVLFTCPFTTLVWRLSHSPIFRTQIPSDDLEENLSKVLDPQSTQPGFSTFDHNLPETPLFSINTEKVHQKR